MKQIFILVTLILALSSRSQAEIWKCTKVGEQAASYTDTPTGGEGINCEKVETIRFTKSNEQGGRTSAPPRASSPPPAHLTSQVRAKVKASAPKAPPPEKKLSTSGKGGNHPSGIK